MGSLYPEDSFYPYKFRAPEFLQGLVISGATAFARSFSNETWFNFREAVALHGRGTFIAAGYNFWRAMAP